MGTWAGVRHRIGRRGAFLLFLAILDAAVGYSLLTAPPAEIAAVHLVLPPAFWAWAWLAVGAVCAVSAFLARDRAGFALAAGLKAAWAGVTARAWLIYHIPQGWVGVIFWLAFAITVLLISGWPEAPPPPLKPPPPVVKT